MSITDSFKPLVRDLTPGMGVAVGERTILRKKSDNSWEVWGDVANRVAMGNALLCPDHNDTKPEYRSLRHHIGKATLLMSGRHLQHGDDTQPGRTEEIFTNCLERNTKILTLEYGSIEISKVAGQTIMVKARDGEWRLAQAKSYGRQKLYNIVFSVTNERTASRLKEQLDVVKLETEHWPEWKKKEIEAEVLKTPLRTNGDLIVTVIVTRNHRWFLNNTSVTTNLGIGDKLECVPGDMNTYEVLSIEEHGTDEVFCVEEPITTGFVLANGLLTGNCSTSATSFTKFLLLLSGSGVGRCYDDDMMLIDWDNAPNLRCVLSHEHADFDWSAHENVRDARHKYGNGRNVIWHEVADSREGWAKTLEIWEIMAFEKIHREKILILDFSLVRPKGSPIGGMQSRPASGPVPLMNAFLKAASLKGSGIDPWRQTIYIDHYFSECVLVGGARRSARMSTKFWRDPSIFDFITVKRPIEFVGKNIDDIIALRDEYTEKKRTLPMGFLWSSNNSITVDREFWRLLQLPRGDDEYNTPIAKHARKVFKLVTEAAYADGTGEPGFINVDRLTRNDTGWEELTKGDYVGSRKYQVEEDTKLLLARLARVARKKQYVMITNPCSEITLSVLSGFCTIADTVPYHADNLDEAEDVFRVATRALIRVNLMDSIYKKEVQRTNRIGVGMTGVHEFAWKFFKVGFRDLINPDFDNFFRFRPQGEELMEYSPGVRSAAFWMTLARFNRAVREESITYSHQLGVTIPHTCTTTKPSGSVSKLFGLTEGWHLPALAWMLRWVQFRHDDPLVEQYKTAGYPSRELIQYAGTVIIGFPTAPAIAQLGMGNHLVLAGDATPEEQYKWLMLGEKYWLIGVDDNGEPVKDEYSGQISYTLKFNPEEVDYKHFREMLLKYQSQVKCCSVMPQINNAAYEYVPEQAISRGEFEETFKNINKILAEDVNRTHLDCLAGGCPLDFEEGSKTDLGRNDSL